MYIFSCCTGIRYADMIALKDDCIEKDSEFGLVITNKRQKVSSIYSTPLWGFALEIYQEFGNSLEKIPILSNPKVNDYIKIALEKINYHNAQQITFHTGRKTFVNHCLNDRLIEPHIVMEFTGHQDIREVKRYGKVKMKTALRKFYQ
ncbi:integrase [Arcicella rosea]|uniref:tyrosine-type recombinase/integrase n=1 Tax=Arcicella rosea TaxID=502909 RepID=UPI00345DA79A